MKKKWQIVVIAFAMTSTLIGCGQKTRNIDSASEVTESTPTFVLSESLDASGDATPETEDFSEIKVSITTEESDGASSQNTTDYHYTYSISKPIISLEGANPDAQDKIQKEIDTVVENFMAEINNGEFGAVFEGMDSEPSYNNLRFHVERADSEIISLTFMEEGYDHGAHGWCNVYYRNFYTNSGASVTFDTLGDHFRETSLELLAQKCKDYATNPDTLEDYGGESPFFPDYETSLPYLVSDGTELNSDVCMQVYGENYYEEGDTSTLEPMYCITTTGFRFTSGQYVLQPYAAGIIDFEISAEEYGNSLTAKIF